MGNLSGNRNIRLCITFILFATCMVHSVQSKTTYIGNEEVNLLVIHSFEESFSGYPKLNKLLASELEKNKKTINIQTFYLDCDAFDHNGETERIYHYLDTLRIKPDIIASFDDQATYSLLASRHPLLKNIPIVFSGVNFPNWELLKEYPNVTGIWDKPDYEKNIEMIEKFLGVKYIRFFYDKTYNGKQVIKRLAEQYKEKDKELYQRLDYFLQTKDSIENTDDIKEINTFLRGNDYDLPPSKTSLHFINMWDGLGRNLMWNITGSFKYSVFLLAKYDYTTADVGRLATVPTFSAVNEGFTQHMDILGGYFTTTEDQVHATCEYLSRIIKGEKASTLPIKESPKKYVLDWNVLNRWEIPMDQVPREFEIVNMPFYIKYKLELIVGSSIFGALILSIIFNLLFLYYRETKRKRQAQMHLLEEKNFLSLAMEGNNIFAWRYNSATNQFVFDKEFLDFTGTSYDVINLDTLNEITHPDDTEQALANFISVVNGRNTHGEVRARMRFNGQEYIWYEFRFLKISGFLEDKSSVIGLVMNIQDYKDKEQELITARDLAAKAELKQSFLANMSHEIRTPLNAIVGFSNMLVEDDELSNEEKQEYIHIINLNCELLLKLINDILELSRIESGHVSLTIEQCDLNEIVEEAHNMCTTQVPSGVDFIVNVPQQPTYIETDRMRLKQVFVNLISNAFKFTSSGHVAIGIERTEGTGNVRVYVEDTGEGIPEKHQKMIFDRFYKVNEFAQGTGLGLSICQVIVTKLNGQITLTSEEKKGSRFEVTLPCMADKEDERAKEHEEDKKEHSEDKPEITSNDDKRRPVVLIAEDSVSNYLILNNILKDFCHIIWAINGNGVLEILRKQKVDLILMDIKMQEMDGITALTKLRKTFKKLPVIIQTAYGIDENIRLAKQAGASGIISKPIRQEVLLNEIRHFIHLDKDETVDANSH